MTQTTTQATTENMGSPSSEAPPVWSATPTPLQADFRIDAASVARMMRHHAGLGVNGVFLGGSCGEGPWLRWADLEELTRVASGENAGGLELAVQVTDNSPLRMIDHAERFAACGAQAVVMAGPSFIFRATPERVLNTYLEVVRNSPLPVIVYDRGAMDRYVLPVADLEELYAEPRLLMIKDSSGDNERMAAALRAKEKNPQLKLLDGDEFNCVHYLRSGYDGLLLGGAIFNGRLAVKLAKAAKAGRFDEAEALQARMNELMWRVYGGKTIACWMSGLKYLLHKMGIFAEMHSLLEYPLPDEYRLAMDEILSGPDADKFADDLRTTACTF